MYLFFSDDILEKPVNNWYNEINYYDWNTDNCTKVCGHYQQVIIWFEHLCLYHPFFLCLNLFSNFEKLIYLTFVAEQYALGKRMKILNQQTNPYANDNPRAKQNNVNFNNGKKLKHLIFFKKVTTDVAKGCISFLAGYISRKCNLNWKGRENYWMSNTFRVITIQINTDEQYWDDDKSNYTNKVVF